MFIGFMGKNGVGKTTAAKYLEEKYGFTRVSLAEPIRQMLNILDVYDEYDYSNKDITPIEILNRNTLRDAMIALGTGWGRNMIDQNLWVNILLEKIKSQDNTLIVCDDVRFENERNIIKQNLPGIVRFVNIVDYISDDCVGQTFIDNSKTKQEFFSKIDVLMKSLLEPLKTTTNAAIELVESMEEAVNQRVFDAKTGWGQWSMRDVGTLEEFKGLTLDEIEAFVESAIPTIRPKPTFDELMLKAEGLTKTIGVKMIDNTIYWWYNK